MKKLFILGLALTAACAAYAMPTLSGATGGFELPTADIAANGATIAVDQTTNQDGIVYPNTRLLVGIGKMLEFGGKYEQITQFNSQDKTDVWDVNAKLQILHTKGVKLAVGGDYGQSMGSVDHQWNGYAAATVRVCGIKATANVGYGKNIGADTKGYTGGFAAEKSLNERTAVGAEYLFGDKTGVFADVSPYMSHGDVYLSHAITSKLSARVAVGGIGQDTSISLGGCYKFGM
jgi:hypothetical protein